MARKKPTSIQFEPSLLAQIDAAAASAGVSRQEWVASACTSSLVSAGLMSAGAATVRASAQARAGRPFTPYPKQGK